MHNRNKNSSNLKFGALFSTLAVLFSIYCASKGASETKIYGWLVVGVVIGFIAFAAPDLLAPLNKAWIMLGDVMGKLVRPLVLGGIFFVIITPVGLIARLFGHDELKMKKRSVDSYWVARSPPGPSSDSFKNQY
jgi:hypothetical protein